VARKSGVDVLIVQPRERVPAGPDRTRLLCYGGRHKYTRVQVAEQAGMPLNGPRTCAVVGVRQRRDDEVVFTENDVEALRMVKELTELGLYDVSARTRSPACSASTCPGSPRWRSTCWEALWRAQPELLRTSGLRAVHPTG